MNEDNITGANTETRRGLLKKAIVGGALVAPVAWSAPTLLLQASPAAAQSSSTQIIDDPGFDIPNP